MSAFLELRQSGFKFGAAEIIAMCADEKKGWSVTSVVTPRAVIDIYVTKTGKIRVHSGIVEWKPVK